MSNIDLNSIIDSFAEPMSNSTLQMNIKNDIKDSDTQEPASKDEPLFPEEFADPATKISTSPATELASDMNETASDVVQVSSGIISEDVFELPELSFTEDPVEGIHDNLEEQPATHDQELAREIDAIPDKMAFKIGEVADIVGVKQYVLRYWETEFEALKPKKSRQNQRMYTQKDIENILLIKKLLYRDKFSIEGARRALRPLKSQVRETKNWDQVADRYESAIQNVQGLVTEIRELKKLFASTQN